jgi:hypothetical protein
MATEVRLIRTVLDKGLYAAEAGVGMWRFALDAESPMGEAELSTATQGHLQGHDEVATGLLADGYVLRANALCGLSVDDAQGVFVTDNAEEALGIGILTIKEG